MPELPEVETLRRELSIAIRGKIIKSALVNWPKMVKPLTPAKFSQKIKNKKIITVSRLAKILKIELSGGLFLIVHLKLTGQLIFQAKKGGSVVGGHPQKGGLENLPNKFTHIIINFKDDSKLFFNDLRKFGWMRIITKQEFNRLESQFGVEPLNKSFTAAKLKETIKKYPRRKIKQILMDQKLIAGVGNIYADESCFCAGIIPSRLAGRLKAKEINKLHQCLLRILRLAIAKRGTSADTYVQLDGRPGGFVPYLKVYGRRGQPCKKCGRLIERIKLNGRGTHFCHYCQK